MQNTLIRLGIVEFKPVLAEKERNVSKGIEMINQAAEQSVDILVFPELWTTGYLAGSRLQTLAERIPGPTTEALAAVSSKHRIFLVGGSIPEITVRKVLNTLFIVDRTGKLIAKHHKANLWGTYERDHFTPGNKCTVVQTEFGKLGFGICFDGDFQEYSRTLALQGARIFLNPSGYPSPDEDDWRIFYPCFARQNGFYVVCTNLVGHESGEYAKDYYPGGVDFFGESKIIDPFGKVVIQSDPARKDTALYCADIDLNLVEKARNRPFFNLHARRPELYKSLLRKTRTALD
jgi:predicted amidohydrolase